VSDLAAAAALLTTALATPTAVNPDAAVLLTIGRQGVAAFAAAPQRFWLRSVDPPEPPLPARSELLLDRGPFTVDGELALMRRLSIDIVVTKNSGGPMTAAKLVAARRLGLPVIMVDRPPVPAALQIADTVPSALAWIRG
jgi:precorrin-6A/cobalt-precorrin-6A reductase